jgi:hypothetical protein
MVRYVTVAANAPLKTDRPGIQALLSQSLDWDFINMQPRPGLSERKKRERAESAPHASVVRIKLSSVRTHSTAHPLEAYLRSARGPDSFMASFYSLPGMLLLVSRVGERVREERVRALSQT